MFKRILAVLALAAVFAACSPSTDGWDVTGRRHQPGSDRVDRGLAVGVLDRLR